MRGDGATSEPARLRAESESALRILLFVLQRWDRRGDRSVGRGSGARRVLGAHFGFSTAVRLLVNEDLSELQAALLVEGHSGTGVRAK